MRWNIPRALPCLALALALTLALAAPAAAQDWVGRGRAHGTVVDQQGNPVAGAKVTLHLPDRPDAGPEPVTTGKNGRWAFGGIVGGSWTVLVEKEGFVTSEGAFSVNEFQAAAPLEIEMQKNPFSGIQEGQDLIDQGKFAEARERFEKVLPDMDEHQQAQLHALIGTTYYEEKNFQAAIEEYETSLGGLSAEEQVSIRLRLGDAYVQLGQHDKARTVYENALEGLGPEGQTQVLLAIARSYDAQGNRPKAIETVERVLAIDPVNVQALQIIADLLSREGRDEEAQAYLDKVPADTQLPPDMLLNLGIRYYNEQKLDEALQNFDRVVAQNPNLPEAYYYRGLVFLNQGKNDQARADFEKLIELAPDSQQATEAKEFLSYLQSDSR